MELHVCGEDPASFCKHWITAANNAQGQATCVCAEL